MAILDTIKSFLTPKTTASSQRSQYNFDNEVNKLVASGQTDLQPGTKSYDMAQRAKASVPTVKALGDAAFRNVPFVPVTARSGAPTVVANETPVSTTITPPAGPNAPTFVPPQADQANANMTSATTGAAVVGGGTSYAPTGITPTPVLRPEIPSEAKAPRAKLNMETTGVIPSTVYEEATTDASAIPQFYGNLVQGTTENQVNVSKVWAAQNTNLTDLNRSREAEGLSSAEARLQDVNRRVAEFNVMLKGVERDVRRDLGGEVTESAIKAEVTNRMRQLLPQAEQLQAEQELARADYQFAYDRTNQTFNAARADAADAVNQAMQKYNFSATNLETTMNLMTHQKNLELAYDFQKNQKRDDARVIANLLITNPQMLKSANPQDIANIEAAAQMLPGSLASMRDAFMNYQPVAYYPDGNDLSYVLWDAANGSLKFGKQKDFFTVNQSTAGKGTSAANEKLASNMSSEFQAALKTTATEVAQKISDTTLTAAQKNALMIQASATLYVVAAATKNAADMAIAESFAAKITGGASPETTLEELNANVQALSQ